MKFLVKVRVDAEKMAEFGGKLQKGELDRSCIRGETYCLKDAPDTGFSIWEAESATEFEAGFSSWRPFYRDCEISEVISPDEAMAALRSGT